MLHYARHARRRMVGRRISAAEVEEAWLARQVTVREAGDRRRTGDVLVIRSTLQSGRRLKLVVPADDEHFIITVADQDAEDG